MNSSAPEVTVVIPNWNGMDWLPGCLEALRGQSFREFTVLVVDNGSVDGSVAWIRKDYPEVGLLEMGSNRGFAAAINAGVARSTTPFVALLNTDTKADSRWLEELVKTMKAEGPGTFSLASKMLDLSNPDLMENGGDLLTRHGLAFKRGNGCPADQYEREEEVFSPCAGAALYRRDLFNSLGGFDKSFFAYLEDVDLGFRARLRGYRCLFVPSAAVLHQGYGSSLPRGRYVRLVTRNRLLMITKNLPLSTLLKNLHLLLYGQFYVFVLSRRPFSSLAGILAFIGRLPAALVRRKEVLGGMTIDPRSLEDRLTRDLPVPSLGRLILRRLGLSHPEKYST